MAKLSYFLRKSGKTDHMVYVRLSHKGSDFPVSTEVKTLPQYIDLATGKISDKVAGYLTLNEKIQRVANDIEQAKANVIGRGGEPVKEACRIAYDKILTDRETAIRVTPKITRFFESHIQQLEEELKQLEQAVIDKKKEIDQERINLGQIIKTLATHIEAYAKDREATAAANTTRLFNTVAKTVTAYDPAWKIEDVNEVTLKSFESWMISKKYKNLSITDTITKIKTVCYANAKALNLDKQAIQDFKPSVQKKRNPNTVYLTKSELKDLIDLELTNNVEIKVRDRFVLMSLVGMRYSDSNIKPENIFNGELLFTTEKTDTDLTIPMSEQVKEILERYDNNIVSYPSQHFNKYIKNICSRIPSLQRSIMLKEYRGKNKAKQVPTVKYKAISAHVARKTFVNLALERGMNPVAIAAIVGHEGTDLIMKVYGSKEAGKEKIASLLLDEEE